MFTKKTLVLLSILSIITLSGSATGGKSVYVITDHGYRGTGNPGEPAKITAYDIDNDQIDRQIVYEMIQQDYPTGHQLGPIDVAVDSKSGYLFVTHENDSPLGIDGIQLINARTMEDEDLLEIPGVHNLVGIVYDEINKKVLTVERGTDHLFVFDWNANRQLLTLEDNDYKTLDEIGDYASGLALDEVGRVLYVSAIDAGYSGSPEIFCYDANDADWGYLETIEISIGETDYEAAGVAVYNDGAGTKYLYTGAYDHDYLVRTDLSDPNDPNVTIAKDIGASAVGIAVDPNTGLVYVTQSDDKVAVYDTTNWSIDPNTSAYPVDNESQDIYGPAGLCIPYEDIGYKPSLMSIEKYADPNQFDPNNDNCVKPDDYITYTICYAPDANDHTDVVITDILPPEVDYPYPSDPNYNWDDHAYIWEIGTVTGHDPDDPNDPNICMELTVKVNTMAEPAGIIKNKITIESDTSYTEDYEETDVCCWEDPNSEEGVIYVDSRATGYNIGTNWDDAYVNLRSALDRADEDCGDEIWVAHGTYVSGFDYGDVFTIPDGVEVYGGFGGDETSRNERNFTYHKTYLTGDAIFSVVVLLDTLGSTNDTILDGFIITQATTIGIHCDDCGDKTKIANCVVTDNGTEGDGTIKVD